MITRLVVELCKMMRGAIQPTTLLKISWEEHICFSVLSVICAFVCFLLFSNFSSFNIHLSVCICVMWVPGIELMLWGLSTSTFTHGAIQTAPVCVLVYSSLDIQWLASFSALYQSVLSFIQSSAQLLCTLQTPVLLVIKNPPICSLFHPLLPTVSAHILSFLLISCLCCSVGRT